MNRKGSDIAKNGFRNEVEIVAKFNNWKSDSEAREWLYKMGYDLTKIENVQAHKIAGVYKSDINVLVQIKLRKLVNVENIQVKLVSNNKGFNQIDKRWLKTYKKMWNMPDDVYHLLEYFSGTKPPYRQDVRDQNCRRMYIDEFDERDQMIIISWFSQNLILILTDVIKGRGQFCAEWILVAQKAENNARWVLCNINEAIQLYYGNGKVTVTPRGSLSLGNVLLQRKGGDCGAETANMLQFKLDPTLLFEVRED